jgi:hypothetical protein
MMIMMMKMMMMNEIINYTYYNQAHTCFFFIPCGPTGQIAVELWGHLDGGPVERPRGKVSRGRPLQTSSTFSEKCRACHGRLKLPV